MSCAGYNLRYNGEVKFAQNLLHALQNHYPERLGLLIICDAPYVFRLMWNMVYPFVDANTKKKILFVTGTKEKQAKLKDLFDMQQVEEEFGGLHSFKFNADEYCAMLQKEEEEREQSEKSQESAN